MKFNKETAVRFSWNGVKGWALSSVLDCPSLSMAYFEIDGGHGTVKSKKSDRAYYVLDGQGKFIINGKEFQVMKGDGIIVPKNTFYDYVGEMKLILVHVPAFDSGAEVRAEEDIVS